MSQPCAPTSSALPKPMEGALASGAVAARPAGAAGEKAAGLIIANMVVEGQRKGGDRSYLWRTFQGAKRGRATEKALDPGK